MTIIKMVAALALMATLLTLVNQYRKTVVSWNSAEAPFNAAINFELLQNSNEAARQWQLATQTAPDGPQFHYRKGQSLLKERRYDAAIVEYSKGLEKWPNNPFFRVALGEVYINKGDVDSALRELLTASNLDMKSLNGPQYASVHLRYAQLVRIAPNIPSATRTPTIVECYRTCVLLEPNMDSFAALLGEALSDNGDFDAADKQLNEVMDRLNSRPSESPTLLRMVKECIEENRRRALTAQTRPNK